MERNLDVIRDVLLEIESSGWGFVELEKITEKTDLHKDVVNYHLKLLYQAGFIEASIFRGKEGIGHSRKVQQDEDYIVLVKPWSLTWEGHEYLDTMRDPEIWKKTKECVNGVGSFSLDTLKSVAKGLIKTKLKQHTGIEIE